jgi:predicted TIM-barrel fold metal-dependent hydrolase
MPSTEFAVDCHLHAHWPQRYAYTNSKGSRIEVTDLAASPAGLFSTLGKNGVTHCLLIQPGAYAHDNRAMLDVIAMSNGTVKAIAGLALDTSDEDFINLKARGVVGVRLSQVTVDRQHNQITVDPHRFERDKLSDFLRRCRKHDFWVEVFAAAASWPSIIPALVRSEVKVLAEHIGWPILTEGLHEPGFKALLQFGRTSNAVIKISGGFRISWKGEPYEDVRPYIIELLDAFGAERCIWGSDWPFLNPDNGPAKRPIKVSSVEYHRELDALRSWLPSEKIRQQILWHNPARFFEFTKSAKLSDLSVTF